MAKRKKTADSPNDLVIGPRHETTLPMLNPPDTPASRRKKTATSRIGRACDRCQHRKLACDPAPEGCPPCQRVNAWCTVTDPLTGTPTYRGEFEYLERQVAKQHTDIKTLVQRLKELGEDVSRYEDETPADRRYQAWMQVKASGDTRPWDREEKQLNVSRHLGSQPIPDGTVSTAVGAGAATELPIPLDAPSKEGVLKLPDLRPGLAYSDPQHYVGVTVNYPSSGKGAKLNILGWQLDLAQFAGKDLDGSTKGSKKSEPKFDRSYRCFVATALGINAKHPKVELPGKEEMMGTVGAFTQAVQPFAPLFHAPSLLAMSARVYDEPGFRPSIAEEVCLHMIVANMYQQRARADEDKAQLHTKSDQHYHYALTLFPHLVMGDKLEDCQALAMIALHVRAFPAPEVGWLAATMTFNKLVQLGYHRSVKTGSNRRTDKSFREIEVQKRVFWTMLVILVTASGKLGRPMPIRLDDFDVEVPMPIADEQLLESGLDTTKAGQCTFLAGIEAHKVAPIYLELYNVMYATKRSSKEYMQFVGIAERRLKGWQDQWPAEFQQPYEKAEWGTRIVITYLNFWSLEFKLLLHHPSLSLTKSFQFNDNNLRACLDACRDMLGTVKRMKELYVLDINWYNCAVYLLVIQTTFYGYGQLKDELTHEKIAELKADMEEWLDIMQDIGKLLGSGKRLHDTVAEQVKIGFSQLEKQLEEQQQVAKEPAKKEEENGMSSPPPEIKKEPASMAMEQHAAAPSGSSANYGNFTTAAPTAERAPSTYQAGPTFVTTADMQQALNTYSSPVQYGFPQHQQPTPQPQHQHQPHQQSEQRQHQPQRQQSGNAYGGPTQAHFGHPYVMSMQEQAMASEYGQQAHHHQQQQHHNAHPQMAGHGMGGMFDASGQQYAAAAGASYGSDSDSWYHYTQSIPNAINPHDYSPAATALLQLGGRPDANMGGMQGMGGGGGGAGGGGDGGGGGGYDASGMSGPGVMWPMGVMEGSHQGN